MKRRRIAVVMGGRSPEHEISLDSGKAVFTALDRKLFRGRAVVIGRDGRWSVFAEGEPVPGGVKAYAGGMPPETAFAVLREWGVDIVFLALHGPFGEDGSIQGFFEILGVPYTASGIRAAAVALDKPSAKALLGARGIKTPPHILVKRKEWLSSRAEAMERVLARCGMPCFVKVRDLGSSVGVFRVENERDLAKVLEGLLDSRPEAMVERGVPGREVSCAVLGNAGSRLVALPPVEIRPRGGDFFDYEAKYAPGGAEEICPASLDAPTATAVSTAATKIHETLGARGVSRSDFIVNEEGVWFLEANAIPGLTPRSILPRAAAAAGIAFSDLVTRIIESVQATETTEESEGGP